MTDDDYFASDDAGDRADLRRELAMDAADAADPHDDGDDDCGCGDPGCPCDGPKRGAL